MRITPPSSFMSLVCMCLMLTGCSKSTDEMLTHNKGEAVVADTLKKIEQEGTIVLGYREASIPFSYIADEVGKPVGYAHDLQIKIVDAIKKELNKPDLNVRYQVLTSQNRIPLIENGTVDIECGSTSNNKERQARVAFSYSFFKAGTRLLTAVDSGIKNFSDLKEKTVVVSAGTTSERLLRKYNDDENLGIKIIPSRDHAQAFKVMKKGRAHAYMNDDILLASCKAKADNPQQWMIVGKPLSYESYGCMLRKDDAAFKALVNTTLANVYSSDEIHNIYKKWFETPIPPRNVNLNFPMSQEIKVILSNPTDNVPS